MTILVRVSTLLRICGVMLGLASACPQAADLPKIRVSADGRGFDSDGQPFVPFGVNYYRPGTGWAPQVWKQFDPEATRRDLVRLRELGGNCVRVFLTYGSFYTEPGVLNPEGMRKLETLLEIAADIGIYVHPTGPDHWEGLPEWARGDRISDDRVLTALEEFWRALATRLRGRHTVFAYDLLNEPEVPWDTPALRARWNDWLRSKYASAEDVARTWGQEAVPDFGSHAPPPREDRPLDRQLLDYQRFREDIAEEWTRRQVRAIRSADPDALITVGLIQWSVPVVLAHTAHYSAFRPDRQAPHVDFLSFHFYPLANGAYQYEGPEAESRNLAYLGWLAREHARFGKPVVIGEFGWYGGGRPRSLGEGAPATEAQQATWCRTVVESTRGMVSGWLNWGFHDHPQARDVSEFTGLLRADGTAKAWAHEFASLARGMTSAPPRIPALRAAPTIDWDRQVTSREAREELLDAWHREWRGGFPSGRDPE